jgi:hypothetical protein
MTRLRVLGDRERRLLRVYAAWDWGVDPVVFYHRWDIPQDGLCAICGRSPSTVRGWFKRGRLYRRPTRNDRLRLALADLLLERYEAFPGWLLARVGFDGDGSDLDQLV